MSLINQMLRDLETRRTGEQLDSRGINIPTHTTGGRAVPGWLVPLLLALLLLTLLVIGWRLLTPLVTTTTTQVDTAPATPAVIQPVPVKAEPAAVAEAAPLPAAVVSRPVSVPPSKPLVLPVEQPIETPPPPRPTSPPLSIKSLWPTSLTVTPGLQDVMIYGEGFNEGDRVAIEWPGGGVVLDKRIVYFGPKQMRIRVRTGRNPDNWTLRVVRSDGSRSQPITLPIVAADTTAIDTASDSVIEEEAPVKRATPTTTRIEKRMKPLTLAEQAEQHYREGYSLLQQGEQHRAESALRQAIGLDSRHRAAAEALTALLVSQGRQVEALELLTRARQQLTASATLAMLHARLLLERDRLDNAIDEMERSAATGNGQPGEFHALLAGLYQRAGRYPESVESYRRALTEQPGNAVWQMGLGISQDESGDHDAAIESLTKALKSGRLPQSLQQFTQEKLRQLGE